MSNQDNARFGPGSRRLSRRQLLKLTALAGLAAGCRSLAPSAPPPLTPTATPPPTPTQPPTATPIPTPTVAPPLVAASGQSAPATFWKDFPIPNFDAVHSPVKGDANEHLIFGNLPVEPPAADLAPELTPLLGRWEGYDYSLPAAKDRKGVLLVQSLTNQTAKTYLWTASILQYPTLVKEIQFRVVPGTVPTIEAELDTRGTPGVTASSARLVFAYDKEKQELRGGVDLPPEQALEGPFVLKKLASFFVYKDYYKYFAGKRITPKLYRNAALKPYGEGYVVYLPEGYESRPDQKWPLIFFLIGTGERGNIPLLLAKHGPFTYICGQGPIPFIVVAPMFNVLADYRSFPEAYMDGALNEILADYRVDPKRIYLTGISMGGEASWRFGLYRPDRFAAVVPISAFNAKYMPGEMQAGFKPFTLPMDRLKNVPVWAIHGARDPIIPLAAAKRTADDLKDAGGNVQFTILPDADHDAWSVIYNDPEFYKWLLTKVKP